MAWGKLFRNDKDKLDPNMNKEFFVLKIKLKLTESREKSNTKKYWGYIYPTNNWVEVHCFKDFEFDEKEYDVNYGYILLELGIIQRREDFPTRMKAKWAIFDKRVHSFIISRDKVIGDRSLIECEPTKEDYKRWKDWHPKDDYLREVWIKDLQCSWVESHLGVGCVHYFNVKTGKENMYPIDAPGNW